MGNNCCNSERNYVGYGFVSDAEYSKPTQEQEMAISEYYSDDPPVPVILKRVNEWKEASKTTSKNESPDKKTLPSSSVSESMKNVPVPVPIPGILNFEKKARDPREREKANSTISSTTFKNYTGNPIEPVPDVLARADKVIEATKKRTRKRKKEPHKPTKGTSKLDGNELTKRPIKGRKEPPKPTKGTSKNDGKEVDKKPIKGRKELPKPTKGTSKNDPKDSSKKTSPSTNESTPNDPIPVPVPGMLSLKIFQLF